MSGPSRHPRHSQRTGAVFPTMPVPSRSILTGQDMPVPRAASPRPLARALLSALFAHLTVGRLTVVTPAGARIASGPSQPGPEAVIVLHRWRTLRRLILGGDVAFAEAYVDGDWSSPDLPALIELAACNDDALRRRVSGLVPARLFNRLRHTIRLNTRRGSRRNIVAHYDLGNSFYARWLDAGMSYSSGLYRTGTESLEEAQTAKQDRIIAALDLKGGEHVLEIGCGWGGLAERLGRLGCRVTGITLSPAQLSYARERIAAAGLSDRVDLRLEDYRDVRGTYDRIVSVEMIEAVGAAYWPTYFATLRDRLAPGGLAALQAITIADARYPFYARSPDFIQRHIFPGGMLPSPSHLAASSARVGLGLETVEVFGASYARTMAAWRQRFTETWTEIGTLGGFDEAFRRLWDFYLAYCEGGFRASAIDVGIYRLSAASR